MEAIYSKLDLRIFSILKLIQYTAHYDNYLRMVASNKKQIIWEVVKESTRKY